MKKLLALFFIVNILPASLAVCAGSPKEDPEVKYPDPQRWAEKIKEFEQWDLKNAWPKDAVLFVGSSSIVYWKTAAGFPDLPVINRGFGGSYAAEALYYVKDVVIKYDPKVVIIYEGDNDIAGAVPAKLVHNDYVTLMDAIHCALPKTEIICLATKICRNRWNLREQVAELNTLNKAYSETKDYITFVDTAAVLLGPDQLPVKDYFLDDQLHLNDNGYAKWNTLLASVIKEKYAAALNRK